MKISVIMQSYLGEYPGARSNPKYKFVRAVNSFLLQKHPDKELVIVADGCDDTKEIYERLFSGFDNIKLAYLSRNKAPIMYQGDGSIVHHRGAPRGLGVSLASGNVITYLDSDDLIMPSALRQLSECWEKIPDSIAWTYNRVAIQPKSHRFKLAHEKAVDLRLFGFPIDREAYQCYYAKEGDIIAATSLISHRREVRAKWEDTFTVLSPEGVRTSGESEDNKFVAGLIKESSGYENTYPSYVVCHYRSLWDI